MKQFHLSSAAELSLGSLVGQDRRRRPRAKVSQPLRVRAASIATGNFEEISTTVNISQDGLYFTTSGDCYWAGLQVAVTMPFLRSVAEIVEERPAEVVRVDQLPHGLRGVAVRFLAPHET